MLEGIAERMYRESCRAPLVTAAVRRSGPRYDRRAIETLLPHRDPFLFVHRITHVAPRPGHGEQPANGSAATIVCGYDLVEAGPILDGHFPGRPLLPGVLQVEAVGQAGLCLVRLLATEAGDTISPACALTDFLGGRCLRPVTPDGELEIVARVVEDGLFSIIVGQCLQDGLVCSAAAVRGIDIDKEDRV